jgi:hypothetical protein
MDKLINYEKEIDIKDFFENQAIEAYYVLSKYPDLFEFIKHFSNNNTGFLWCEDENIKKISNLLNFQSHSGSSFALTLRKIQFWLKHNIQPLKNDK